MLWQMKHVKNVHVFVFVVFSLCPSTSSFILCYECVLQLIVYTAWMFFTENSRKSTAHKSK
jgi:hypothetical protein